MSANAEEYSDDEDSVLDILLGSLPLWCEWIIAVMSVPRVCAIGSGLRHPATRTPGHPDIRAS